VVPRFSNPHNCGKRRDPLALGRWVWVQYKGKTDHSLRVFTAYRPATIQGGPFTVYAQQRMALLALSNARCPLMAFMEDLCQDIEKAISTGDSIILLIDGNEDMQLGTLAQALSKLHL